MLAISGGRLVSPGLAGDDEPGVVLIDGATIVAAGPQSRIDVPAGAARLDAAGAVVAPGFVDVHVHGGAGADFMDASPEAVRTVCRFHAAGGTTALLATTAAAPLDELLAAQAAVAAVVADAQGSGGAAVAGVHLEGPYFAPTKHGCHLLGEVRPPRPEEYRPLLATYPGLVRWMTLAPELPGALDLIRALRRAGAVAAAGHTEATEPQILAALDAGLSHATHLYCAMSTITKDGPRRVPGLVETALASDRLTTEVIADGHHLAPALLTIAARAKGTQRLLLVTDAMRGAGMPDGRYAFGPRHGTLAVVEAGIARTMDNTGFASSTVRTCDLVTQMMRLAGCGLAAALEMASLTPARALGLAGRKGRLAPGFDADVVLLDRAPGDTLTVRATLVGGVTVYRA
jgi:N-acetylglucosamine-6-phosphate deacetylase